MNTIVKDKIILENKKNELLKRLAGSEKRLFDYKEILKKKDNSAIITTISHLAQELGLKILSVKPEREQDFPIYTKSSIRLSILSEGYHRLGDFISKLEASADLYKIEVLNIKPGKAQAVKADIGKKPETEQRLGLSVDIVITKIAFKG
jgi:Tfp pilus assembly protein PilO